MARTKISSVRKARKFRTLIERDTDTCYFCRRDLTDSRPRRVDASRTIDHIITVRDGGTNNNLNLVLACNECNNDRGDMDFLEFILTIRDLNVGDEKRYQLAKIFRKELGELE